ncbi:hypothetical protein HY483_01675 [Candidatus Woesearchaeota archaeon]|nr:hypothetical protein [Candidatus Woesearchaeota archaeon]
MRPLLKNWKVLLLLSFLLISILLISPRPWNDGIVVRSVVKDSASYDAGLRGSSQGIALVSREKILAFDNVPVSSVDGFNSLVSSLEPNKTFLLKTSKSLYSITTEWLTETIVLNETETVVREEFFNESVNGSFVQVLRNVSVIQPKTEIKYIGLEPVGINVEPISKTNIKKGLDLQGGTRVLLQPEKELSSQDMDILIGNMQQRLNVYGLSDLSIRSAQDLPTYLGGSGRQFIIIEIAGATEEEVKDVVSRQGKFEATIANVTVFRGGSDITYVCRTPDCSGIDPNRGCGSVGDGFACTFSFAISLSQEAASRQADVTKNLKIIPGASADSSYLEYPLELFLDNENVDTLQISAELKGRKVTDITISGSGSGLTSQEARQEALKNMKRLQTILITGSLPVQLSVVKVDTISPSLGENFLYNAIIAGIVAIFGVGIVVFARYRLLKITIPIMFTMISEIVLILGFAVLVGWDIDLAAIAGIIIVVGTGVDHQIVITDEVLTGRQKHQLSLVQGVKNAFSIIFMSYATVAVALIPLAFAGAGLLKGFALTSLAGATFGVIIARPAFSAIIQHYLERS